jgi:hypothetical protein
MLLYLLSKCRILAQNEMSLLFKSGLYSPGDANRRAVSLAKGMVVSPFNNNNDLAEGLMEL